MEQEKKKVVVQKWEKVSRRSPVVPDGFSLHLTESDKDTFIQEYWDQMRKMKGTPEHYSRPFGPSYEAEVDVVTFDEIIANVSRGGRGIQCNNSPPSPT